MHQAEKTSKEIAGTTKFGLRTGKLEGHWRTIIFEEQMWSEKNPLINESNWKKRRQFARDHNDWTL